MRVNCNVPFGLHRLLPLVPRFTATHPKVRLDIALTDRVIDLMDERADVAIRVGSMRPSQLMARKLRTEPNGRGCGPHLSSAPGHPHKRPTIWTPTIASSSTSRATSTSRCFVVDGTHVSLPARGDVVAGDGEISRRLALAGQGVRQELSLFHIRPDIKAGRLCSDAGGLQSRRRRGGQRRLCGPRRPVAGAGMRALIDFLAEEVDLDDALELLDTI